MTVFAIIFYSFVSILLFYGFYLMLDDDFDFHKKYYGRNHCGIVCWNGCGGDIHFDEMTDEEIYEKLKNDYFIYREFDRSCCNAEDKSDLAEYRILLRGDKVKTIGYITKDKVVFEGKEYIFDKEEKNDS